MAQPLVEVERKWRVHTPPDLPAHQGTEVMQGDIALDENGTEVRLRRVGERCFQTDKPARGELEVALTQAQFEILWPTTAGRRLAKTRYRVPWAGTHIEIDVYSGSLAGLVMAEVEFPSAGESGPCTAPPWCGTEVTEDAAYKNVHLALHGQPGRVSPPRGTNADRARD